MKISVIGIREVRDYIGNLGGNTEYAASVMLNNLSFSTKDYLSGTMDRYIDRPTPFTRSGLGVATAKKGNLQSKVFVKSIQASYLSWQIEGGISYPKNRAFVIPWKEKRNRYGNLPAGKVQRLLATSGVFSGTVRGVGGIWQRWTETENVGGTINIGDRHLQLLVAYEPSTRYRVKWPMLTLGVDWASLRFSIEAQAAINRALK